MLFRSLCAHLCMDRPPPGAAARRGLLFQSPLFGPRSRHALGADPRGDPIQPIRYYLEPVVKFAAHLKNISCVNISEFVLLYFGLHFNI